ncbi:hypothetical protein Q1695_015857 [Nippostrongylus brasiliensis]|nr:hypothetical protein Q1695_015857 [Nippostrongylus brasiliensis]
MEIDDGHCSSSDAEGDVEQIERLARHSAVVKMDLDSNAVAQAVLEVLRVDKEPSRSNAVRQFSVDGSQLVITVTALDRKSLQKSLANVFDMCDLAKSTIDLVSQKKWIPVSEPMFKGLKSKLEDEAKKLQASVQQYSEQLSQQVEHIRGASSDAGSESGSSITRRFLNTVGGSSSATNVHDSLNLSVGNALMEEVTEGDLLGLESSSRQRRLSGGSTHSNESSLSTLFQSIPGLSGSTLDPVDFDDNETLDEWGSGVIKSASKDQISSVLSRLQGRASNYKDKYRELVKKYNDVVTENNKCRTVLAQTQDKALDRIEKLKKDKKALGEKLRELEESRSSEVDPRIHRYEEMLEKCKAEITRSRAKIKELSQENEKLAQSVKSAEGDSDMSTLVADRVANEWKQRIDKVEEEWTERMNKNDTDHALQLATTKADMHAALESKDKEIELWRSKCRVLEIQDGQANERWQKKVDDLQLVVEALEAEKSDMIEKLSAAKVQGVRAVRDEEEQKREELVSEFAAKEENLTRQLEEKIKAYDAANKEILELRDELEKARNDATSLQESVDKDSDLSKEVERLRGELFELEQKSELEKESLIERHRLEIAELTHEQDQTVSNVRQQHLIEMESLTARFELAKDEADNLRIKNDTLERQLEQLDESYTTERVQSEKMLQAKIDELRIKLRKKEETQQERNDDLRESYSRLCVSNDDLQKKIQQLTKISSEQKTEADQVQEKLKEEIAELRDMLEIRKSEFTNMELKATQLEEKLAAARELSIMQEHLQAELVDARRQRDEVESIVAQLRDRAERAERALEGDRAQLKVDSSDLERSVEQSQLLIPLTSESDMAKTMDPFDLASSTPDLSTQTAGEMRPSDEIRQLRAEIAQLSDLNTELSAKVGQLEVEKEAIKVMKDEAEQLLSELKMAGEELVESRAPVPVKFGGGGGDVPMNDESAQLENIRLNEELRRNMEEIEVARNHRATLEKELLELRALISERHSRSEEEVLIPLADEPSDKQTLLEKRIVSLEDELKTQKQEVERLSQLAETERGRADEAIRAVQEKVVEHEAYIKDIDEKAVEVERLRQEIEKVKSDENSARAKCQESEEQCRQLESRIEELSLDMEKLTITHNGEREEAERELNQLRQLQLGSAAQLEQLTEKLKACEEALNSKERDLESAKSELESARSNQDSQISAFTAEIFDLKEKLKTCETATEESERSTASLREVQESLAREEKRVLELREQLENERAQITTLQSEAKQREDELRSDQASPAASKVRELEELNDKMRLEFIAKASDTRTPHIVTPPRYFLPLMSVEKIISELRVEIERIHTQHMESVAAEQNKFLEAQKKIEQLDASEKQARNSLMEMQAQIVIAEEKLRTVEKTREKEKYEEERIREQYANALENLKTELAEAHGRISASETAESECQRLKKELDLLKKQCEDESARQKEEAETAIQDYKLKAEKMISKIKTAAEKDVTSTKAELLLEMDDLRRNLSERDRRIDELIVEKARTEQQLIGQQEMEKELEQRRVKEKELNESRKTDERRIVELEGENRLLEEKNAELADHKERSEARAEEDEKTLRELQEKENPKKRLSIFGKMIKSLETANEEGFRKAAAKLENDNKRAVRELQREVRQLYTALNEKTEALHLAQARIAELESSPSRSVDEPVATKQTNADVEASPNYGYEEELESMRKKLKDSHREVDGLREANSRLERLLEQQNHRGSPAVINVNGGGFHDGMGFADPAEAEYLRNVLYRYMSSRESLGKEAVTLARVIGTVAKFTKAEMDQVLSREESRVAGWVGGTVSHVLTGRMHLSCSSG